MAAGLRYLRPHHLLLLLLFLQQRPASCAVGVLEMAKLSAAIVKELFEVWQWAAEKFNEDGNGPGLPFADSDRVSERIRNLNDRVLAAEIRHRHYEEMVLNQLHNVPAMFKYELESRALMQIIFNIDRTDRIFKDYLDIGLRDVNNTDRAFIEDHTLFDLLETITSHHPDSVRSQLEELNQIILVDDNSRILRRMGLFHTMLSYLMETEDQICESSMSRQQLLYNLFAILQMSQLKAYTMIQFSWLLLRIYNKGNFTSESNLLRQKYMERMQQQATSVKESMKDADNILWRCDPYKHEQEKTYTQVTRVLQGFLVNEVDLNKDKTCREDCPFYKYTKQHGCFDDYICGKQPRCHGNIVGCQFVDSDMWVCQAPTSTARRYDWIEYENGRVLGTKGTCKRQIRKVDSWWRWLFWHCSFCYCFCDDAKDPLSDRFFNMRAVVSDKANNKVITGIKFTKVNRIIHLQIQEGELLPLGTINETTLAWKPVDDYKITDHNVVVGEDYHMLTWESRAIDLDDLKVPQDCVITGVKLRRVGGHLNLEVLASKFNFTKGNLLQSGEKSYWVSNDKTDVSAANPRTRLNLPNPDVPTKSFGPSHPDSKGEQFVEFTSSDMDADAAQTTVPFIDTQEVAPKPATPLSGIGLYHKGRKHSGGFIAPRVHTYDFSEHILDNFPEVNEAES